MPDVTPLFQVRGNIRPYFSGAGTQMAPMLSDGGAQIVTQGLPERAELVKLGSSWGAAIPTGSAFTYVNAWPTTRSEIVFVNGEASGGPTYIVDRVWMADITSGATGSSRALLGQIVPASGALGVTGSQIADTTTVLRHQLSGRAAAYGGNAKFKLADLQMATANQWFPLGNSAQNASTVTGAGTIGMAVEANVYGRLLLPPGATLCLAGLASSAAGTAIIGVEWHEVFLNLG